MRRPTHLLALALLLVMAACTSSEDAFPIDVRSSDDTCEVAPVTAPGGTLAFKVTNDGSAETEFYLYAANGTEIISEVEDIGPGLSRTMTLKADPGSYITACKPGMVGDGIRATFTVTDPG